MAKINRETCDARVTQVNAAMLVRQLPSALRAELMKRSKGDELRESPTYFSHVDTSADALPHAPRDKPLPTVRFGDEVSDDACGRGLSLAEGGHSAPGPSSHLTDVAPRSQSLGVSQRPPLRRGTARVRDQRLSRVSGNPFFCLSFFYFFFFSFFLGFE